MSSDSDHRVVLILDDLPEIVRFVKQVAFMEGYEPFGITSTREAFDYLSDPVSIASLRMAILDFQVGHETSIDVYRRLRDANVSLPVVFMSGSADLDILVSVIEADPCASFLAKPLGPDELRELIHNPLAHGGNVQPLLNVISGVHKSF